MLMRHFGYGVGHMQHQRQQEIEPNIKTAAEGDNDYNAMEAEEMEELEDEVEDAAEHEGYPEVDDDDIDDNDNDSDSDGSGTATDSDIVDSHGSDSDVGPTDLV